LKVNTMGIEYRIEKGSRSGRGPYRRRSLEESGASSSSA
jgi:hypothetical protein